VSIEISPGAGSAARFYEWGIGFSMALFGLLGATPRRFNMRNDGPIFLAKHRLGGYALLLQLPAMVRWLAWPTPGKNS
jgi:hypothetical protein